MKKCFIILWALLLFNTVCNAYDFKYGDIFYMKSPDNVSELWVAADSIEGGYAGKIDIPDTVLYNDTTYSVTAVMSGAFSGCYNLTEITLPRTITAIGSYAFNGCINLRHFTVPINVTWIGEAILQQCNLISSLTFNARHIKHFESFYISRRFEQLKIDSLVIGDKVEIIPANFVSNCERLTSVHIPSSVDSIGIGAFSGCVNLQSFSVDNSNIRYSAIDGVLFNHDGSMLVAYPNQHATNYTTPASTTSISSGAFANCNNLASIDISEGCTSIGASAFWYCNNLKNITLPQSLSQIGDLAFGGCSSLQQFSIDKHNPNYSVEKGVLFNKKKDILIAYPNALASTYSVPNKVSKIGKLAFAYCDGLQSIKLPKSLLEIDNSAFRHCNALTSIDIPNKVTFIGKEVFANCRKLASISLPQSINHIGDWAFAGCKSLTNIALPNNIDTIQPYTFNGCSSLDSVIIGKNTTSLAEGAFYQCKSLSNIVIPNLVTTISRGAFYACDNLRTITLGKSVRSIGTMAFAVGGNLQSITALSPTPPTCSDDVFYGVDFEKCQLIIPDSSKPLYMAQSPWNLFSQAQ